MLWILKSIFTTALSRAPSGLLKVFGGWKLALIITAAVAVSYGAVYGWGHSNGVSGERASWEQKVAAGKLVLAEAALRAERDAQKRLDELAVRAARLQELNKELENEARLDPAAGSCGLSAASVQRVNTLVRALGR